MEELSLVRNPLLDLCLEAGERVSTRWTCVVLTDTEQLV